MRLPKQWKWIVGSGVSLLFLWLAFRKADIGEVTRELRGIRWTPLVLSAGLGLFSVAVRAVRWGCLLAPVKKVHWKSLYSALVIGLTANNLLPARIGEVVKAVIMAKKEKIGKSTAFATIVVERVFDGLTILAFLLGVLVFSPIPLPEWIRNAAIVSGCLFFIVLGLLVLLTMRTRQAMAFLSNLIKPLPVKTRSFILRFLNSFIMGLQILQHRSQLFISAIMSVLVWIPVVGVIHILLRTVGLSLPVFTSFFLLSVLSIGIMVPSGPGYVGTIQFVCVACLALFGVSRNTALSFSVLYHGSQFIPLTIIGLVTIFIEGFNLKQLDSSTDQEWKTHESTEAG